MRSGLTDQATAPILVLGVGNVLLGDDGFGPSLLELLQNKFKDEPSIEFVDGGTQGLALLGYLANRNALLVLDAMSIGRPPGTVCVLGKEQLFSIRGTRASTAHEGNAFELLAGAAVLGDLPGQVYVVGVEPAVLKTGIGLSNDVQASLTMALEKAQHILEEIVAEAGTPVG